MPPSEPSNRIGKGMGLWAVFLLFLACAGGGGVVVSTFGLIEPTAPEKQLIRWHVIQADDPVLAMHDDSANHDGTAGCAFLGDAVVRWDDKQPTGRVTVDGATVTIAPMPDRTVRIQNEGTTLTCPFAPGEGAQEFAAMIRARAEKPQQWMGWVDPRVKKWRAEHPDD